MLRHSFPPVMASDGFAQAHFAQQRGRSAGHGHGLGRHYTPGYMTASRLEPGLPCRSYMRFDWQRHPFQDHPGDRGAGCTNDGASSVGDGVPAIRAGLVSRIVSAVVATVTAQAMCRCFRRDERLHQTDPGGACGFRVRAMAVTPCGRLPSTREPPEEGRRPISGRRRCRRACADR